MLLRPTAPRSLVAVTLLLCGVAACRSTAPNTPNTRPVPSTTDRVDAALGVPYSVVVQEIRTTYDLALGEIREAYELLPRSADEEFRRDKFPHAGELLESAIKRVNDHEALRSKAWKSWPELFIDLAYLRSKAEKGLVLIAFANLVVPGQQDAFVMHLNRHIAMTEPTLEIISQSLRSRSADNPTTADIVVRYRQYETELADYIAQAYLLLGAESNRAGNIAGARGHWERALTFARDETIKSLVKEKLQQSMTLTGTPSGPPALKPPSSK